jgi:N-acetyltransferase
MPLEPQPTLTGSLLKLRPLKPEDFDALYAVASDPLLWKQHPAKNRYQRDVFTGFFQEALASGGALVALDARDDRVIGTSRYYGYDAVASEVEIGWSFLARSYWGGAYNREMKHLMLAHAFHFVAMVYFLVGPQNLRSQRAMEKIGGVPAGNRRNKDGFDCRMFQITAAAYRQKPLLP